MPNVFHTQSRSLVNLTALTALLACLMAPLSAKSDETKAGTYNETTSTTSTERSVPELQSPGIVQQEPGISDSTQVSSADSSALTGSILQKEGLSLQPQIGWVNYRNSDGAVYNRAMYGLTASTNVARYFMDAPDAYVGPQIGFLFSHLGADNANWLGSSPENRSLSGNAGANAFIIPTDLKIGYNVGNFRPSIHAGANLFYRSVASSMGLSKTPDTGAGSAWSYLPNVGLDLEYAFAKGIAIVARPDLTFGGSFPVWNASLGASFPMG